MARNQRLTKQEIQEDKFIEGLLTAYAFLKANLQTIIVAAVVVLVAVGGYAAYYQNQENRRAEATLALRHATEAYQKAEESLFDAEKLAESEELLKTAQTELKAVFEKYSNTTFADKARYQYANTLYYQGNYPEARTQFQQVMQENQPENQMDILYAQKAIGNTYEQEGDYQKAIEAYQANAFPSTPQLSPEIRKFVLMEAKLNQALAYEKSGDLETARNTYKAIIDEFRNTLETGLTQKSKELLAEVKAVITAVGEPLDSDVSNPKNLEFTLPQATFNQILADQKSDDTNATPNLYQQITHDVGHILQTQLAKQNLQQIENAKVVMTAIAKPIEGEASNPEKLEFMLPVPKLNQALADQKSGDANAVHGAYHDIADGFREKLGLVKKNFEQIETAKVVLKATGEPFNIDISNAEKLETENRYFEAYVAYADALRTYRVRKDIHGGLSTELRKQISNFEKGAMTVIKSIQNARRAEDQGRETSALYSYDVVVELETLGLSRRLYENALFRYKILGSAQ